MCRRFFFVGEGIKMRLIYPPWIDWFSRPSSCRAACESSNFLLSSTRVDLDLSSSLSAPRHLSNRECRSSEAASTLASNSSLSLRAESNWRFCSLSWDSTADTLAFPASKSWLTDSSLHEALSNSSTS